MTAPKKREPSIRVSPKHGVNPMLVTCYVCGEDTGELALLGALPGDAEAPRRAALDKAPCAKCRERMAVGVIFISCLAQARDDDEPYRTGGWVVVRREAVERMGIRPPELARAILDKGVAFVDDQTWDALGLPRGEAK